MKGRKGVSVEEIKRVKKHLELEEMLEALGPEDQYDFVLDLANDPDAETQRVGAIAAIHLARTALDNKLHVQPLQLMLAYGQIDVAQEAYELGCLAHPDLTDPIRQSLETLWAAHRNGLRSAFCGIIECLEAA